MWWISDWPLCFDDRPYSQSKSFTHYILKWSTSNSQPNYFPHILGKIMRPPNMISNSESQTSFLSLIFSEGRGGGSVHRLGIPSKEGSEITNSVQIYTCSSKNSAETHLISFKSSSIASWRAQEKAKKEKGKKGNKMDRNNRCMGKFGDFRAIFYF